MGMWLGHQKLTQLIMFRLFGTLQVGDIQRGPARGRGKMTHLADNISIWEGDLHGDGLVVIARSGSMELAKGRGITPMEYASSTYFTFLLVPSIYILTCSTHASLFQSHTISHNFVLHSLFP